MKCTICCEFRNLNHYRAFMFKAAAIEPSPVKLEVHIERARKRRQKK